MQLYKVYWALGCGRGSRLRRQVQAQHELQQRNHLWMKQWKNDKCFRLAFIQSFKFSLIFSCIKRFACRCNRFFSIWNTYIRLVVIAIQETNRASTHLNCIAVHRSRFCNRCCKTPASAFGSICKLALLVSLISETSGVWTCDYKRDTWL